LSHAIDEAYTSTTTLLKPCRTCQQPAEEVAQQTSFAVGANIAGAHMSMHIVDDDALFIMQVSSLRLLHAPFFVKH
jgi:hypothetical protein